MQIKNGQVLTTGGAGVQDANLKQVSSQSLLLWIQSPLTDTVDSKFTEFSGKPATQRNCEQTST